MNFKHIRNLQESIDGMKKVFSISWSPNLLRLAVAHVDERRFVRITLFDENGDKKEMFQTKAANKSKISYLVRDIAFSPDSSKLAVSQSDCIIFIYNLGHNWGDKKIICNKFEQNSPVTTMVWPINKTHELFFGIGDGKVKMAMLKNNSAQVLYTTGSYVVSLTYNQGTSSLLSGHMDHSIYHHSLSNGGTIKVKTMTSIPFCLSYLVKDMFLFASMDKKVYIHSSNGELSQTFDYSSDDKLKDFTVCRANSNLDLIAVGNYNKVFIFGYNTKPNKWEESCVLSIENYYTFTALCWKQDFGVLVTGSLCGSLDMFESCLKKTLIGDKFEITHISLSQIMVKDIDKGKRMTIKTHLSPEITKVGVQNNNFITINTENSLIVGDLSTAKWSEVPWNSNGNEKFDFNNLNTCLVYVAGEIAVIELGNNDIVGYFRTEYCHPNLISAKISSKSNHSLKLIAFLVDPLTIYIQNLDSGAILVNFVNDSSIEFLEFNKSGNKLVFRDSKKNLNMLSALTGDKVTLLALCGFVQWIPNTEVLVAQSPKNMIVWYNIENYLNPKITPIKGTIEEVRRAKGKIEVLVNEINQSGDILSNKLFLDENYINLSVAIDEQDLVKAITILEMLPQNPESTTYWKALARLSVQMRNLPIAKRCFASLGNYSKMSYIKKLIKEKEKNGDNPLIEAKMLVLEKQFIEAEEVMIRNNMIKEAIDVFKELHKYEDSLRLAAKFNLPEYETMKQEYFNWLIESEMFDKAAEIKRKDGALIEAIKYYIQGDLQMKAANLIIKEKVDVDKSTLDYLINSIRDVGLIDKSEELKRYASTLKAK